MSTPAVTQNPYGLSQQDIADLQVVRQQLPAGDPRHAKLDALLGPAAPSAPTLTNQFRPGFAEGVSGAAIGVDSPESLTAAEARPTAGDWIATAMGAKPLQMAGGMVKDYASNLYNRGKTAMQDAYDAGQSIGNGQPVGQNLGKAALGGYQMFNAAIPFVGEQANKVGEDVAQGNYGAAAGRGLTTLALMGIGGEKGGLEHPEIQQAVGKTAARSGVEAVLQPQAKQFRFGKDPVGFIVDNGISANSFEELHTNIESKVNDKVQQLDAALKQTPATVNLASAKKVVTNAIQDAMQKRDAATVGKLTDVYQRLSNRTVPGQNGVRSVPAPNSIPAWEAAQVKRGIQESINWSDQTAKPVNNVLMQVQHEIGDTLHKAVPETAALDESISSGIEAKKAAEVQWLKDQAGKRTFKNSTRATVGGALIGGAIGGPTGAAMGAGIGKFGAKALGYPTVGTYLSKVLGKP